MLPVDFVDDVILGCRDHETGGTDDDFVRRYVHQQQSSTSQYSTVVLTVVRVIIAMYRKYGDTVAP